ncbi:MBL fold metallo-hydrolase [Kordiimonas sp.]|uniref:MBL fold metallo-hydrolase n=1 Tax=Kordiimonas sp. TaxID=1970157 RepID=UPI003A8E03A4
MNMQMLVTAMLSALFLHTPVFAGDAATQPVIGSLKAGWYGGAQDCSAVTTPQLEVHAYNHNTYILRQSLCATFEAPFMYLLIGEDRALLIDTGGVKSEHGTPVSEAVMALLPMLDTGTFPLTVVHSHGHSDHKAGDPEFENLPSVTVIKPTVEDLASGLGFTDWPNDLAQIDLGDRTVHAIPTPGHHKSHVVYYDEATGLVFSGDFLLPGRLIVDDTETYLKSAERLAVFIKDKPVTFVLGAHVELNKAGDLFEFGSQYHPDESGLALQKEDILTLPTALQDFNGFYNAHPHYVVTHPKHMLMTIAAVAVVVLGLIIWGVVRFIRRRKR